MPCRGWDLNPHIPFGIHGPEPCASANFATTAIIDILNAGMHLFKIGSG